MTNSFHHTLNGNLIWFYTFWSGEEGREICTGFDIHLNRTPPNRNDRIIMEKLISICRRTDIGIFLERSLSHRRIILGRAGELVYGATPVKLYWFAELALCRENTPAFDWLTERIEQDAAREDQRFHAPGFSIQSGPPVWSIDFEADRGLYDPLSTPGRASAQVRIYTTVDQLSAA